MAAIYLGLLNNHTVINKGLISVRRLTGWRGSGSRPAAVCRRHYEPVSTKSQQQLSCSCIIIKL